MDWSTLAICSRGTEGLSLRHTLCSQIPSYGESRRSQRIYGIHLALGFIRMEGDRDDDVRCSFQLYEADNQCGACAIDIKCLCCIYDALIAKDRSNGISTSRWRAFIKNLCAEWVDTNLLASQSHYATFQ